MCAIIFLVRLEGKFEIDHSYAMRAWNNKELPAADAVTSRSEHRSFDGELICPWLELQGTSCLWIQV